MNAIEIRNLTKSFKGLKAVNGLSLTVPVGAIYGFIGENGSGKSTTEKLICGHLVPDSGEIKLFGKDYRDAGVRQRVGALIENAGCFPNCSVYTNMMMQALNLNLENPQEEISRVLKTVRMEQNAKIKFKNCSLGMKQRIGIAIALLGSPALLILDEPINGLDTDGMALMREILVDITKNYSVTVLISSHILGELEKIATHYGIIRSGKMIAEMTAEELDSRCPKFVAVKTVRQEYAKAVLSRNYSRTEVDENGYIRVFDAHCPEDIVALLYDNGIAVSEIRTAKISLEEYYIDLMHGKEAGNYENTI